MTAVDGCVIALVLLSVVVGIFRGFVREVLGLAGLALSVLIAWRFGVLLAPYLTMISTLLSVRVMAATVILFILSMIICTLLAYVIGRLVRGAGLGLADRILGGTFGVLRGVLIAALLVMLAAMTPLKDDPWWRESAFIPRLEWLAGELVKLAPVEWRDKAGRGQERQET